MGLRPEVRFVLENPSFWEDSSALFSIIVLLAHSLQSQIQPSLPQTDWYAKSLPTFVDALALVRVVSQK